MHIGVCRCFGGEQMPFLQADIPTGPAPTGWNEFSGQPQIFSHDRVSVFPIFNDLKLDF